MSAHDPNEPFRERRARARRRRAIRRFAALALLIFATGAVGVGTAAFTGEDSGRKTSATPPKGEERSAVFIPRPLPDEMRGIHVTMALAALPGKLEEYFGYARDGMNTLEVDVKDENGEVAFASAYAPLARRVGAAKGYYRPRELVRKVQAQGLYLIGRVVTFEDPILAPRRPDLAIHRRGGGVWVNDAGLGWTNPYDQRVWKYNVDVAEGAARAGFDEIMFDYVRFPSDGDVEAAVFPRKTRERKEEVIARFLAYARERLSPLGVRVSAAVFGLSATRDLGIGQRPRLLAPHVDALYPMVYPSHYGSGEYGIEDPNAAPGATVTMSLRHFRRAVRGTAAKLIPWLQDFSLGRTYTLADVRLQVAAARRLASAGFLLWNAAGVYQREALAPRRAVSTGA